MVKHVGRHGDKKVVILFRTVPGEEHMCLVCYSDLLPRMYHDAVMKVLESEVGQQAVELSDALHRNLLPDGRLILQTLHRDGLIKKVQTSQVIVTPDTVSSIRLDELNDLLSKMSAGEEAIEKMKELDAQSGLRDPKKYQKVKSPAETSADIISDSTLAKNLTEQATRMRTEAQVLISEADKLSAQAQALTGQVTEAAATIVKVAKPRARKSHTITTG